MFGRRDRELKEFADHTGLPVELCDKMTQFGGRIDEWKQAWKNSEDRVELDKIQDELEARLETIPSLLEKPTMKKLTEAILIQNEYIVFMRDKKKEDLKNVTVFGHAMGIR